MNDRRSYQTWEFWLCLAVTVLGGVSASGILPVDSEATRIVGMVASVLTTLGYTKLRIGQKSGK